MPRSGPVFQDHHAIEQQTLQRSPLLKALSDAGRFDIHAIEQQTLQRSPLLKALSDAGRFDIHAP